MNEKYLCVLAEYDKKTEETLKRIQEILAENNIIGKQTPNIPYHITLGTFPLSYEQSLIDKIDSISKDYQKFTINLLNFGLFGLDVLFLQPNMNIELLELQKKFSVNNSPWVAHTTLLIDNSENILKALPIVVKEFKGIKTEICKISLYEFSPTKFISRKSLK